MDDGLRPRDIQARIRAGQSSAQIASATGMDLDKVERFEAPVLAERAHIADRARSTEVRHSAPGRTVDDVVQAAVKARGADPQSLVWDSWRRDDGLWTVTIEFGPDDHRLSGRCTYDLVARAVFAEDDVARSLLDPEAESAPYETQPAERPRLMSVPPPVSPDDVFDHAQVERVEAIERVESIESPSLEAEPVAEEPEPEAARPAPTPTPARPKPARGKRASIPSWDEILFGVSDSD